MKSNALLGQTILDLVGEKHCNDVMEIIAQARAEALEEAVEALEEKQVKRLDDERLSDFQDGYVLGIRVAIKTIKGAGDG